MSIHSTLMQHATQLLVEVQGDTGVEYTPPRGLAFPWTGAITGAMRGSLLELENGDLLKVTRLSIQGPTAVLTKNKVTQLERGAVLSASGHDDWSIDIEGSTWGPNLVRLELLRRPIAEHEQLEDSVQR